RPGGLVLLYEHVRPTNPLLARLADAVSPWTRRTFGPELNRRTEENVAAAGMTVVEARRRGIWRELVVTP
ncbi:MAG: SAM-dependent methyltransferase, partial [Actinomycetota bacterium]